ncbi:tail fiber assembly protein [Limnobaculum xujianqingii]|uniref:tail fiber assembly protein n=1 Tax=Limnobaculum xujianqingii TaxID=2738837 RepID=UPI0015B93873|nr:tail fiber assembly protein [Limnobaculum xujianqingii]
MIKLKNLKSYQPENPKFGLGVSYLQDDDGNDWYELQKLFKSDTLKIATDNDSNIVSIERDVSMLTPMGFNVTEIAPESVPDSLQNDGTWMINANDEIVKRVLSGSEAVRAAELDKSCRLSEVTVLIAPLSDAVDLGIATDEEKTRYDELRKYRVLLSRVDTSKPEWPKIPE